MTTEIDNDRSPPWLALLVGALIAVIVAIGYLIYSSADANHRLSLAANLPEAAVAPQPQPIPAPVPIPAR